MFYFWLCVLIVALAAEIATLALVSVWFAFGAAAAMCYAYVGFPLSVQIIEFICVSALFFLLFLLFFKKKMKMKKERTNTEALLGASALVEEKIEEKGKGRVLVSSMSWQAEEKDGKEVEKGEWVSVVDIRGVTLICEKKEKEEKENIE